MIALKVKDEEKFKIINKIDTIIRNRNLKAQDIEDLYNKGFEFYKSKKKNSLILDLELDIEGFSFKNEDTEFNKELEDFIINTLKEKR